MTRFNLTVSANHTVFFVGYIGGTALEYIHKAHPDYEYTLLVRNEEKGKPIKEKYPKATLLYGSLEDSGMVRDAAKAADIVIGKMIFPSNRD